MSFKKLILKYTPPFAHRLMRDVYFAIKLLPGYVYDFGRYFGYSGLNKSRDGQIQRAARITLFYHQVEKGLSLAAPRPGFGMAVISGLLDDIDAYLAQHGAIEPATTAIAVMRDYVAYHARIDHQVDYVRNRLNDIIGKYHFSPELVGSWQGGAIRVTRDELAEARMAGFSRFFESRYSVRHFSGEAIPPDDIRRAVEVAQKTPSVCNRQSWRVHAFSDAKDMERLLEIQSGSRGFGELASVVLVVTSELRSFLGVAERYQPWIDGGMFAMALCLSFHDLGYGTCCLNWSKEPATDRQMRAAAAIPPSEQIIMLIAVGTLPNEFNVARSHRPPVEHCLVMH